MWRRNRRPVDYRDSVLDSPVKSIALTGAAPRGFPCRAWFGRSFWPRRGRGSAARRQIPVEDFEPVPVQHAVEAAGVVVDRFEVFDPVRLAADVGVDRERHDLRALLALGVEPVELVDRALEQILALVMLHD